MKNIKVIEVSSIYDILFYINAKSNISNYEIIDDKIMVYAETGEKFLLDYNLYNEKFIYNATKIYINTISEKLDKMWQDIKYYGYCFGSMVVIGILLVVLSNLLASIMPLIAIILPLYICTNSLKRLICLNNKSKILKKEYEELNKYLRSRKIAINHKEYELNKVVIDEVSKNDCVLQNLNIDNLNIRQLKKLSIAACGEQTINNVESKQKTPVLTKGE